MKKIFLKKKKVRQKKMDNFFFTQKKIAKYGKLFFHSFQNITHLVATFLQTATFEGRESPHIWDFHACGKSNRLNILK